MIYAAASSKTKLVLTGLPRNIETPQVAALALVRAINGYTASKTHQTTKLPDAVAAQEPPVTDTEACGTEKGTETASTPAATTEGKRENKLLLVKQNVSLNGQLLDTESANSMGVSKKSAKRTLAELNRCFRDIMKRESTIPSTWNINILYLAPGKIRRGGEYVCTKVYLECRTIHADEVIKMLDGLKISEMLVSACVSELTYAEQETNLTVSEATSSNCETATASATTTPDAATQLGNTEVVDIEALRYSSGTSENVVCTTEVRWALNQRVPRQGDPVHLGQNEKSGGRRPRKDALEGTFEKLDIYKEFVKKREEKPKTGEMIGKKLAGGVTASQTSDEKHGTEKALPALLEYLQIKAEKKYEEKFSKKPAKAPPAPKSAGTGKSKRILGKKPGAKQPSDHETSGGKPSSRQPSSRAGDKAAAPPLPKDGSESNGGSKGKASNKRQNPKSTPEGRSKPPAKQNTSTEAQSKSKGGGAKGKAKSGNVTVL